jgi:hypothetical protein
MKIIFLDFDGVITIPSSRWHLKASLIRNVRRIVDETGAKIVVSSSWRHGFPEPSAEATARQMADRPKRCPRNAMLNWLSDNLYDCTPYFPDEKYSGQGRGGEIQTWLDRHPDVENYVILDDDGDMLDSQLYHFVQTNYEDGLTEAETVRAIKVLNRLFFENKMALNFRLRYEHLKQCEGLPNVKDELYEKYCDLTKDYKRQYNGIDC